MDLTQDLRLVFPVRWNDAGEVTVRAYHTPISREVFEANWRIIAATSAKLLQKGVGPSVVSIATLALKDAGRIDAADYGLPEGLNLEDGGMAVSLLAELKRLTMILSPGQNGYEMLPVDVAIDRKVIDADDWAEADDALVFFTCGWWSASRQRRAVSATPLALALGGSITSSSPAAYMASLATSIPAEISSAPAPEVPQ